MSNRNEGKTVNCICCKGTGQLGEEDYNYLKSLLEPEIAKVHEFFYAAVFGLGEAGNDSVPTKEDLDFLRDLDISPKN
jgi:hypothetical protein